MSDICSMLDETVDERRLCVVVPTQNMCFVRESHCEEGEGRNRRGSSYGVNAFFAIVV